MELYKHKRWLEVRNFRFRKKNNCTIHVAKTKAMISFTVTAKLICVLVFANAKHWFSHDGAQGFVGQKSKSLLFPLNNVF